MQVSAELKFEDRHQPENSKGQFQFSQIKLGPVLNSILNRDSPYEIDLVRD